MKLFSYDSQFEWTENTTWYASDNTGAGWDKTLSFVTGNYLCPQCAPGDSLKTRIAMLDTATRINTSEKPAAMMIAWLKVGAGQPSWGNYMLSLDAICEPPK
jgi:hypothetical protein